MVVRDTDPIFIDTAVDAVKRQTYGNWRLYIVGNGTTNNRTTRYLKSLKDKRIRVIFLKKKEDKGRALNKALSLSKEPHVVFVNNLDILSEDALYEAAKAIKERNPDLIYSDEDTMTLEGRFVNPHFKPNYSPDTILSYNYIGNMMVLKRSVIKSIGGLRAGFEYAQHYDLLLRYLEASDNVFHISKILYHRRVVPEIESLETANRTTILRRKNQALKDACSRRGVKAFVSPGIHTGTFRVRRKIARNPLVSIIIPFRDKPEFLKKCLDSILDNTSYDNFNILGMDNDSREKKTIQLKKEYEKKDKRIKFYKCHGPFNFSKINNSAVKLTEAEHIVFLNDDVEIITAEWIEAMLEHSQRPDIGAVGAKLYYPDGNIQHAGIIIGIKGVAGHSHKNIKRDSSGYFYRSMVIQNVSAVTGACLMIKRRLYIELGGLDEKNLPIAFNDTDFCLRLAERGYLSVFTPYAELYHYEAATRGRILTPKLLKEVMQNIVYFKKRHKKILKTGDPYYNPNLPIHTECFGLLSGSIRLIRPVGMNISF